MVQCLRLCTFNAGHTSSIPDRVTKIPQAVGHGQKHVKKKNKRLVCQPSVNIVYFGELRKVESVDVRFIESLIRN